MNSLANALPANLGLPIKIKKVESLGFLPNGPQQKRGGVKFDIEIEFSNQLPAVKGENVVIYPNGEFELDKIGFENPQYFAPIGATTGSLRNRSKTEQ